MDARYDLENKMRSIILADPTKKGFKPTKSQDCADVAIQYAIDVLNEVSDDVGGAKNARKVKELQSLLKQPQP